MFDLTLQVMRALPLEYLNAETTVRCLVFNLIVLQLNTRVINGTGIDESNVTPGCVSELSNSSVLFVCLENLTRLLSCNRYCQLLLPLLSVCNIATHIGRISMVVSQKKVCCFGRVLLKNLLIIVCAAEVCLKQVL